ncbi:hypothetical protein OG689_39335 [Kitasatospora sp. NBC_00240]|uniref:hypothetical protein n=1 Tax=Kitasatospora sp. NBC_00240 TaxID=2903567 RepID=UPI00225C2DAB|nr:hypothetical protein [Kitasatospora sp. NBC_00240]MCX5215246.1 hypothetical protein [Kitasatospora sp. NBC_00240]
MFLFGLLLLGASGAFVGLLIAENLGGGPDYTVAMFGNDLATLNSLGIFLAGIALALVFCLGLLLATGGGILRRRRSKELRSYRAERAAGTALPGQGQYTGLADDRRGVVAPIEETGASPSRSGRVPRHRRLHFGR